MRDSTRTTAMLWVILKAAPAMAASSMPPPSWMSRLRSPWGMAWSMIWPVRNGLAAPSTPVMMPMTTTV
jgi:hypothetical protein